MKLKKIYPLLVAKAEKKGRTRSEVDQVTCWLTGYSQEELNPLVESGITYGDFFRNAPAPTWTSWWMSWPRARPWKMCCENKTV